MSIALLCGFFIYNYYFFISKKDARNLTAFLEVTSKIMESKLANNKQTVFHMIKATKRNGNNPHEIYLSKVAEKWNLSFYNMHSVINNYKNSELKAEVIKDAENEKYIQFIRKRILWPQHLQDLLQNKINSALMAQETDVTHLIKKSSIRGFNTLVNKDDKYTINFNQNNTFISRAQLLNSLNSLQIEILVLESLVLYELKSKINLKDLDYKVIPLVKSDSKRYNVGDTVRINWEVIRTIDYKRFENDSANNLTLNNKRIEFKNNLFTYIFKPKENSSIKTKSGINAEFIFQFKFAKENLKQSSPYPIVK